MKIKLLKKVRKRYSITRWDKVDDPNNWLYHCKDFPIWVVEDSNNSYRARIEHSYDDAYKKLVAWIKRDYYFTTTRDFEGRNKRTKEWHKG